MKALYQLRKIAKQRKNVSKPIPCTNVKPKTNAATRKPVTPACNMRKNEINTRSKAGSSSGKPTEISSSKRKESYSKAKDL